jgi:hypothetical protein
MTYPNSIFIPGTKPMIPGQFVEVCTFEGVFHYQFTINLKPLLATESITIQYSTKNPWADPQNPLPSDWSLEEPPVTLGPGPFPGAGNNKRENYRIDFIAAKGIKIEAQQVGGTAKTLDWCMVKV